MAPTEQKPVDSTRGPVFKRPCVCGDSPPSEVSGFTAEREAGCACLQGQGPFQHGNKFFNTRCTWCKI